MSDTDMKPSEILERAADLIEPEGKWTQDWSARDADGRTYMSGRVPGAVCWCAIGAIEHVTRVGDERGAIDKFMAFLDTEYDTASIDTWNDEPERTQSEVVSALRKAAHLAKEQEGV